jgi:hypothetical protein
MVLNQASNDGSGRESGGGGSAEPGGGGGGGEEEGPAPPQTLCNPQIQESRIIRRQSAVVLVVAKSNLIHALVSRGSNATASAKTRARSCGVVQEAALVVKSVQDGVLHDRSGPVEAMLLALHVDRKIQRWIGEPRPQGRVWSAAIVMRSPRGRVRRRCSSVNGISQSRHSRRSVPMSLSQSAFASGLRTVI